MSQLGQRSQQIEAAGGQVLAAAVTATFSQQAFSASLGVPFPLLSDWGGRACGAYGVRYDVWKGHAGVAKRSLFVLDRQRTVRYRWHNENAMVIPDFDPALSVLAACR